MSQTDVPVKIPAGQGKVLEGVRIVELARWQAAPRASMIMRDMGAEVKKLECGKGGDLREGRRRLEGWRADRAGRRASWLRGLISAGAHTVVIRCGGPDRAGQLERCARDVLPLVHDA